LQYAWLEEFNEVEVQIYDKMGLLYYLQGDIKKAQHFHERSMNYLVEQADSQVKRHALETIRKYQRSLLYKSQTVSRMMLAKLGMLGSRFEDDQESESEQLNQLKLATQVDFKVQLQ
jgi:formamidopyrimidine-DNA glycosylase